MSTVLLATDGSDLATAAITRGINVLGGQHRFVALHVVPPAYVPAAAVSPMDTHPTVVDPELERELERADRAESSRELEQLVTLLGVAVEPRVEVGDPGQTICDVAAELGVDVVVIGSHGHGWLQRVLMGSVSHHVLQHAPCPVLMVRPEEARAADG
ncbi:MAG: universal stress protein A-like protein [Acidimicrobiales bacterium]|nr:universal stress protein A-like protein [Acidimicrobiales bacterium]